MAVFRHSATLIGVWLLMRLSWCRVDSSCGTSVVSPAVPACRDAGAQQLRLRLRGGSDLRAEVESLENVLHKSVELTRMLAKIEARRGDVSAGPASALEADARRSFLKDRVLPLFATAVPSTCSPFHALCCARRRYSPAQTE
jgi:hypothetical protein